MIGRSTSRSSGWRLIGNWIVLSGGGGESMSGGDGGSKIFNLRWLSKGGKEYIDDES